jgi:ParB/RepB/Spo0J family partition protein
MEKIPLDLIDHNPYQPRLEDDLDHITQLAQSIQHVGLLQVPVGRRQDGRIQLAFGHSRLNAYIHLCQQWPGGSQESPYKTMPVEVRDLTDLQMFEAAVSENLARRDLSPIETAKAMQVYKDKFGKNSDEIGQLFGISGSAVRGKLRLLDLPEELQNQVTDQDISEKVAKQLLAISKMPAAMRQAADQKSGRGYYGFTPTQLEKEALAGTITGEAMEKAIQEIYTAFSQDLQKAIFPALEWEREDPKFSHQGSCKDCPLRIKARNRCTDLSCFERKTQVYKEDYLFKASEASGIRPAYDIDPYSLYKYQQDGLAEKMPKIREAGCDNLMIAWKDAYSWGRGATLEDLGFNQAQVFCSKRAGSCSCLLGLLQLERQAREQELQDQEDQKLAQELAAKRGAQEDGDLDQAAVEDLDQAGDENQRAGSVISADDLAQLATERRREIREARLAARDLNMQFQMAIYKALAQEHPGAWEWMAQQFIYNIARADLDEDPDTRLAQIQLMVAQELAGNPERFTGDQYKNFVQEQCQAYGLELEDPDPEFLDNMEAQRPEIKPWPDEDEDDDN